MTIMKANQMEMTGGQRQLEHFLHGTMLIPTSRILPMWRSALWMMELMRNTKNFRKTAKVKFTGWKITKKIWHLTMAHM